MIEHLIADLTDLRGVILKARLFVLYGSTGPVHEPHVEGLLKRADAWITRARRAFQVRVADWVIECFGPTCAYDRTERNWRFLEEALELVQALGCTREEAIKLVDYTFGRPPGDVSQEVGGVLVTLAALCQAAGVEMLGAGEVELDRVLLKVEEIRRKHAAKPHGSPLLGPSEPRPLAKTCPDCAARVRDGAPPGSLCFGCAWS